MGDIVSKMREAINKWGDVLVDGVTVWDNLAKGLSTLAIHLTSGLTTITDSITNVFSFLGRAIPYSFTIFMTILALIGIIKAESMIE